MPKISEAKYYSHCLKEMLTMSKWANQLSLTDIRLTLTVQEVAEPGLQLDQPPCQLGEDGHDLPHCNSHPAVAEGGEEPH
jgi:hypothetical protein